MNVHLRFRLCVYMMVLLSLCAYAVAESSPLFGLAGAAVIAASWFLVERPGRGLPRWGINIGVLLASLLLFWELTNPRDENLLRALAHFMLAILACKLFEKKGNRDYSQILTLSLMVIVTGAIFTTSLLFGVVLAGYLAVGLYAIVLFHLRTEFAGIHSPFQMPKAAHPSLRRDIRLISFAAMAVLLLVAGVVFVAFPRNKGRELLSNWALNRGNAVSGFSEHMMFTDFGRLQQSTAVVMEVHLIQRGLDGGQDVNIGSPGMEPYLRGTTFEDYDPATPQWTRGHHETGMPVDLASGAKVSLGVDPATFSRQWVTTQRIRLYPTVGNILFSEGPAISIQSADIRAVTQSPRDGTLATVAPIGDHVSYEVETPILLQPDINGAVLDELLDMPARQHIPRALRKVALEVAGDLLPDEIRAAAAAGADGSEITRKQAADIAALLGKFAVENPLQTRKVADRIESYLHDNYAYSLEIHTVDNTLDPVSDFILNRKQFGGHCEYFAAAMVLMCESLGIPARMVTGYHGGDFNSLDGTYTVRQKDAHAWVEVLASRPEWKHKLGWVQFDPTPSMEPPAYDADSWRVWIADVFEVVQRYWLSSVVSFDNGSRQTIANIVVEPLRSAFAGVSAFIADQFNWRGASLGFQLRQTALWAALLAACAWLLMRRRQRRRSDLHAVLRKASRGTRKHLSQDLAFFEELMRLLRRHSGAHRVESQTPREFAAVACQSVAGAKEDAIWLVDRFYELRFGTMRPSTQLRAEIASRLSRMRQAIKSCRT